GEVTITSGNAYTATTAGDIDVSGTEGGRIVVDGPGRIVTSADLTSVGTAGSGGQIDISSDTKTSLLGATLDASGTIDGGQIRIGGEFQGGKDLLVDELANSSETLIGGGTRLKATGETGAGGTAIIWSDDRSQFYGGIDVSGGNDVGGFVEISSAGSLVYQTVDEVQTGGGTVLLDPKNGVIVDAIPSGLSVIEFALANDSPTALLDSFDGAGTSVALNADGTLLVIGAPGDDGGRSTKSGSGAIYLFRLDPENLFESASSLEQIVRDGTALVGGTLTLDAGDAFGQSVALSQSGNTLAVGAAGDDPDGFDPIRGDLMLGDTGAVYLFNLDGTAPSAPLDFQQVVRDGVVLAGGGMLDLLASEAAGSGSTELGRDRLGAAVALNGSGDRLAVGTLDSEVPRILLFELNGSDLAAPADLRQTIGPGIDVGGTPLMPGERDLFGSKLALNATGDLLAIGAPNEDPVGSFLSDGAVYLFELDPSNYASGAQFQQKFTVGSPLAGGGSLMTDGTLLGASVAFAKDGQVLGMGAYTLGGINVGGVVVVGLDEVDRSLPPTLLQSASFESSFLLDGTSISLYDSRFPDSLAFNQDASVIAVGVPRFDGLGRSLTHSGGVILFSLTDTEGLVFEQILADFEPTDSLPISGFDEYGTSVALNNDATRLAVSGTRNIFGIEGLVHLFGLNPSDLGEAPTLDRVIQQGLFVDTPVGTESLQFDAGDRFGAALSFNAAGDRLAVGAPGDDFRSASDADKGAIYLFEIGADGSRIFNSQVIREDYTFADNSTLTLSNSSEFGTAIALDAVGNRLVAGQSLNDRVFLFDFGLAGFSSPATLAQTLEQGSVLADGSTLDFGFSDVFGTSVAISDSGGVLAVGEQGVDRSSVFLFGLNENDWSAPADLGQQLQHSSPLAGGGSLVIGNVDEFGSAVGLSAAGDRLAVGQQGSRIHLFELSPSDLSSPLDLVGQIDDATVLASGSQFNPSFGFGGSVALNGTGNVIAAGDATATEPRPGQVFLFEFETGDYSDTVTVQQALGLGARVNEFKGLPDQSEFGNTVAMDADGDRLAVGADNGSVYLFESDTSLAGDPVLAQIIRSGSRLSDGQLIDLDTLDRAVDSIDFNGDGTLLAVGTFSFFGNPGEVALFSLDDTDFSAAPALSGIIGSRSGFDVLDSEDFGSAVSLNFAGDRLAVGAQRKDGLLSDEFSPGAVYLFDIDLDRPVDTVSLGQIIEHGTILSGGDVLSLDSFSRFGGSVSLNDSGDRLAVGSPRNAPGFSDGKIDVGAVHLFELDAVDSAITPRLGQVLQNGSILAGGETLILDNGDSTVFSDRLDTFGASVALDGTGSRLFVGAWGDDGASNESFDSGAVYQFDLNSADYSSSASLNKIIGVGYVGNPGGVVNVEAGDQFGKSLAVTSNGDLLAVGSPGSSFANGNARAGVGSVFLIRLGAGSGSTSLTGDLQFSDNPGDTTFIDPDDVVAILNAGNDLILQFSNDLEIRSDFSTAATGVGKLTLQAGRNITLTPGTDLYIGDGSLMLEFNSDSAIPGQREPGDPTLRLNEVSILASGENSTIQLVASELDDAFLADSDPLVHISDSIIGANEVIIGVTNAPAASQRVVIDDQSLLAGN
ncbi:MAG: FG-GAP repeat protein, partial [Rhodopirellula bahusiensis]